MNRIWELLTQIKAKNALPQPKRKSRLTPRKRGSGQRQEHACRWNLSSRNRSRPSFQNRKSRNHPSASPCTRLAKKKNGPSTGKLSSLIMTTRR